MSNPRCQWPGCECEARTPKSKYCEVHRVESIRAKNRAGSKRWRENNPTGFRAALKRYRESHPEVKHRENQRRRERYAEDMGFREAVLSRNREAYRRRWMDSAWRIKLLERRKLRRARIAREKGANPEWFLRVKRMKMQECPRLHLRALNLPCGQREICSGCERIGGRRVEFRETGFKFGRGA